MRVHVKYWKCLFLLLFGFLIQVRAQEKCKQELKDIFRQMQNAMPSGDQQMYYLNYAVKTVMADSANHPPQESTIELWLKGKLMEIKSKEMLVYQDQDEAFVVIPAKKMIMRNDAVMDQKEVLQKQYALVQDTLLKRSTVHSCIAVKGNGYNRVITLRMNEQAQELSGMYQAEYYVDTEAAQIKQVRVYYTENHSSGMGQELLYTQYSFTKTSYDYKGKTLHDKVENKFMKNAVVLKEAYKGFSLVDNRQKAGSK